MNTKTKKQNYTKNQHYISKSYLDNFCFINKKNFNLWVYTHSNNQWRSSTPKHEAFECDFQTLIDEEGNKSDALEKSIATDIEGPALFIINRIIENKSLPNEPEKMGALLSLMGLFAIRIPAVRQQFANFETDVSRKMMGLLLKDERTWNNHVSKAYKSGYLDSPSLSYAEAHSFFTKGFSIKQDPMWVLKELLEKASRITDYLACRHWMVVEAVGAAFITSSKPVNPIWSECLPPHLHEMSRFDPKMYSLHSTVSCCYHPYKESPGLMPNYVPGYGLLNTIVTFPISQNFALIGSYYPLPIYRRVDYFTVQAINWVTANSGAEYVYAARKYSQLPWCREFIPYLHLFHRHLGSRLISYMP
jgi:hypothetical protein